MMKRAASLVVLFLATLCAQAQIVQNGRFQSPWQVLSAMPDGWSGEGGIATGEAFLYYGAVYAHQGAYLYQTDAGLRQTITLAPGSYVLHLRAGVPHKWPSAPVVVRIDGREIGRFEPRLEYLWQTFVVHFDVATAGAHVLELGSDSSRRGIVFLAEVSVDANPLAFANASFEAASVLSSPAPAWNGGFTIPGEYLAYYGVPPPPDGREVGYGTVSQSLWLEAGSHSVVFKAAVPERWPGAAIEIRMDGAHVRTVAPPPGGWKPFIVSFYVATSGNHSITLERSGVGSNGLVFIDDVRIARTALPISIFNHIANGGFESPYGANGLPVGWEGSRSNAGGIDNAGLAYYGMPPSPEGSRSAFLHGAQAILRHTVSVPAPSSWVLMLRAAAAPSWSYSPIVVRLNGNIIATLYPSTGTWEQFSVGIPATAGESTLELVTLYPGSLVFVDDVWVRDMVMTCAALGCITPGG